MSPVLDREQPGKIASGVMAVAVHVVFFLFLVFNVSWQRRAPEPVVADLWASLPPVPAKPVPAPRLEVKPPPPAPPEVKPEPRPAPRPEPEPRPAHKPDIVLEREKLEKAKREEREKLELRKREEAKAEQKRREDAEAARREAQEKQKLAALERERSAREAERARLEKEQAEAVHRLAQQQAAAQNKELDGFKRAIEAKVKRHVARGPCAAVPDAEIVLELRLLPDGNAVAEPLVRRSSGSGACDEAVRRAAVLAQPLPLPPPGHPLSSQFVNTTFRFRPND